LVADFHLSDIGILHWQTKQRHAPCGILKMNVNRASIILSFASWIIYVPIVCRHPFMRYWHPLLAKTIGKYSLPHPENDRPQNVTSFSGCRFDIHVIARIVVFMKVFFIALSGKHTIYQR
jgi:hypothetical protein